LTTILVIEDDPTILKAVRELLTAEHFQVLTASNGQRGYLMARSEPVDCIILDLKLPEKNGEDICRDLRKEGATIPILMLTSKKMEMDKVIGLEIGADDYMTKPFGRKELVARVRALLRRGSALRMQIKELVLGDITIDFVRLEASRGTKSLKLSSREFAVLQYFAQREGEVVTREMLLNDVWGYEHFPTTRTVDNYILSLRKKLNEPPGKPRHILTVHTSGYKFLR